MSKWIRGIYNAAANFNLRNALQCNRGRTLGGRLEHVREKPNESNQHVESREPIESSGVTSSTCTPATCTCARTSSRNGYRTPCKCTATTSSSAKDGELPNPHGTSCSCPHCRDYNEYTNYTISASREDVSPWVWVSNESRDFKQADADSADSVERRTGIPTGVTV